MTIKTVASTQYIVKLHTSFFRMCIQWKWYSQTRDDTVKREVVFWHTDLRIPPEDVY